MCRQFEFCFLELSGYFPPTNVFDPQLVESVENQLYYYSPEKLSSLPSFTQQVNWRNRTQVVDYVPKAHTHYTSGTSKIDPTCNMPMLNATEIRKKKFPESIFFPYLLFPPPRKVNNGKTHDISTTDYCVSPFS